MTGERVPSAILVQATTALDLSSTDPVRARRMAESVRAMANGNTEAASVAEQALGMAYAAQGRLTDAEQHLRTAIDLADDGGLAACAAEARGALGYVLTLTGRTEDALRELDRAAPALQGQAAARLQMQRALVLTEISRFDEAAAGYGAALATLRGAGGDDLIEAAVRNNRSILRVHRGDWRGAEEDLRRAEALYTLTGHSGRTATVYHNRGLAAAVRGDLPAALSAYDEAAERYRAAGRSPGLLPIERAEALLSVRLVAEARQAAEAAVVEFARQRNAVDLVQARLLLAEASLVDGDPEAALAEAERARRSSIRQGRAGWAALSSHLSLRARWEGGQWTAATLSSGRRTVAALTKAGWVVAALDARLIVARIAIELGRLTVARRELAEAGRARRVGPAQVRARAWHATALLRLCDGDRRGADAALRAGMRVLDRFRASLGATDLRAHASGHAGELAGLGLRLAVESGHPEPVLRWAERWRAGALRLRPARPPDDDELARDLAELRQVVVDLGSTTDPRGLLRRQAALEETIRSRARHATGVQTPGPEALPTLGTLSATLGSSALVEYLSLAGQLYAVVIVGGRIRLHELGPIADAERELAALLFGLRRLGYQIGTARSLAAAEERAEHSAQRLDALLLGPLRADIGDRPLVIVPTGSLHAMPWPVLAGCAGRPVSITPSASLWHRAATTVTDSDGRRVLASGPGLPHATAEVAALARRYPGSSRFTGRRAQVDSVRAALDGAELGHIAAHGHLRADNPLFSSLQLVDGPLTVYDLERLGRPPRHIVLSACNSGLPAVHPGDELLGLASALLAMGTRSLVAAVVPVPDSASRPLMLRFHQLLDEGHRPAAALAGAQQDLSGRGTPASRVAAIGFVCFGAG
jgi:tetratricopeptide (TPR) repeat protein